MLNPHIFRAYDVRGLIGNDINPEVFEHVGRAYGTLIRRNAGRRVAVGQDNRPSSRDLKASFIAGVRASGIDVVDIGLVTTPLLYFATAHWKLDGGANITGSHNPVEYNGVKMGQDTLHLFPGLCAVDNPEHVELTFKTLAEHKIVTARAGAYKPRTSPYDFQGHGKDCLPYLFEKAGKYGIKIIAMEVTHESHVDEIRRALAQTGNATGVMVQASIATAGPAR